ncbi:hypothetical protein [Pikeienuella sp. HZG-20]|uniref:hypothetical protein n=1 Tax=Paludibacillus litoralis TaxID=3133267 RepID=UPI0030EF1CC9
MTRYPINAQYDMRDGLTHDGMAETAEEARAIMSAMLTVANEEPTEAPEPYITSTEVGPKGSREQLSDWWADEIAAGYVTPIAVYGGYVAQVEYWTAA